MRDLRAGAYNSRNDCAPDGAMLRAPLHGVTAGAPYEESRCKPAFWNHRPKFAPNRHGFHAHGAGFFARCADRQGKCRTQRNHAEKGLA
jgi:hypothetical protein